ncbi:hypothetical protein PUNSTDRAFT_118258 [Punctularia strigosozonata HHB-11173 SS5]|uniref:uncharacterized protein n=1 Tax=Punctularia strigosozonata (strain HHB-11173) TaxID=741275 RepID=UPI000441777E|nr:uncharacterized protein PUNSTDRAFT_118258 [Punctularia strigosozonata HHB-11173 SS5]EIN12396.1 hypothetical protein PUNSTDRAFT_118258 [Punctularia strigosozonata HHB-11173 SS5]
MSGRYPPQGGYDYPQGVPISNRNGHASYAQDAVQDAQRLHAMYPPVSSTPTTHVARHLSSLTITANPPSYVQPSYYAAPSYDQGSQSSAKYWTPGPSSSSHGYQPNAFASSIYQHTAPASSYPTPPPSSMYSSSSSLAGALGDPAPNPAPRPHATQGPIYQPQQSSAFFDDFVKETKQRMDAGRSSASNGNRSPIKINQTQPLPTVSVPRTPSSSASRNRASHLQHEVYAQPSGSAGVHTPQKRKAEQPLESPSIKRISSSTSLPRPSAYVEVPVKPSSVNGASSKPPLTTSTLNTPSRYGRSGSTPSNGGGRMRVVVELPPSRHKGKHLMKPSSISQRDNDARIHDVVVTPMTKSKTAAKTGSPMVVDDDGEDLGGYDQDDQLPTPSRRPPHNRLEVVLTTSRRTGDRDERAPVDKLTSLLEDIFEAEDCLPADISVSDLPSDWFSPLSADPSKPYLAPHIVRKLTKYISQVAHPNKRARLAENYVGSPIKAKGGISDVDSTLLARVLGILKRSVKAGEDLEPLGGPIASGSNTRTAAGVSPTKSRKGTKKKPASSNRAKSGSPEGDGEANGDACRTEGAREDEVALEATEEDLDRLTRALEVAKDSVAAADCCLSLLGSGRLNKQLYTEDLIASCFETVKTQLTKLVYPFVEASFDTQSILRNPILHHLTLTSSALSKSHRRQLAEAFQAVAAALPRITDLVSLDAVTLSESLIIQAVYIAIGPFFVADGGDGDTKGKKDNVVLHTLGNSAMRGLRLDALSLIRSIFANHGDQRKWIIEEILGSLIKLSDTKQKAGQFRLRDGRSIRTVSALLLQLVQTSAHDVRMEARRLGKARVQQLALRRQESINGASRGPVPEDEPFLDQQDRQEIQLYTSGLESAMTSAKTIILFLTQRSGKGKTTKNTNEAEYRAIFDNLINDLLTVLFWPEWPAAGLLLSVACKFMVTSLSDVKSISQTENNAAKAISLDHLGVIASRIRASVLKHRSGVKTEEEDHHPLSPMDEIASSRNSKLFAELADAHQAVVSHLCKRSSEDQACESARELIAAIWGQELAQALKQLDKVIGDEMDDIGPLTDRTKDIAFGAKLKATLRDVWKDPAMDVFDVGSQDEVARIDRLAEEIGTLQSLRNSFNPVLNVILAALDAPPVFMRTKALRALGQIVTSDPSVLSMANVRRAIEDHLSDSSPAVRDAAVELIGKYMVDSPEVAGDYYQKIADRVADVGLGVRKRVIKLLKSFYSVTDQPKRQIDICTRLVLRMYDEDDSVKDLATRTLEELWFTDSSDVLAPQKPRSSGRTDDKTRVFAKTAVIMGVSANFKDRQSPLEEMLHKIMAGKTGSDASALHARYTEVCEALLDGLIDCLPGFNATDCTRTIYLFTSAYPAVLSGSNASALLPYLNDASTPERQIAAEYVLKIFRATVPHLPKTAVKFGHDLQSTLQKMVIKPTKPGSLQESVACLCSVVDSLTHDHKALVMLLKSCEGRLQPTLKAPPGKGIDGRSLSMIIMIVSLLVEHCDFDRIGQDHPDLSPQLDAISTGPIREHIYYNLLNLYKKRDDPAVRGCILQCLGFLFRAQPTFMTANDSASVMDDIFTSPDEEGRGRLLKIIQDFLLSQAAKDASKERSNDAPKAAGANVDMDQLVGNTGEFAESGYVPIGEAWGDNSSTSSVASAVVQRYMNPILQAAFSTNASIQASAVDILSFTIKQGLTHPLTSFPVIVALETSANAALCARANALHSIMNTKHASIINTRFVATAKESYAFQKRIANGPIQGYRMQPGPTALLQSWYSHVREKRATRQEFLKAMVKVFEVNSSFATTQDDVEFTRYMTENFSAFDYKTQEEVLTIIKSLTSILSTAGMQLLEVLSPSHLLAQLHSAPRVSQGILMPNGPPDPLDGKPDDEKFALARTSVVVAMIMLLKSHLKAVYSITEEKCSKFVVGKKSAVGDRPATRRHEQPISWDRLPFAKTPISTAQDAGVQRTRFLEIWNEDGVAAEPDDDFF